MLLSPVYAVVLSFVAGIVAHLITRQIVVRARALGLVQVPNERSSHRLPTPSGGGLAITIVSVVSGAVLSAQAPAVLAMLALAAAGGALGFVDDLRELGARLRFGFHFAIIGSLVFLFMPYPDLPLALGLSAQGMVLMTGLICAGVWWVNLYNFMDGIDGLAGSQAILIVVTTLAIWVYREGTAVDMPLFWVMVVMLCGTLGFLVNNWPPARIFMGDAGSNFLAVAIFGLLTAMVARHVMGYGTALILIAVLASDATVTLLRRMISGEKPWKAHRRHAYQQLSRLYGHRTVTLAYGAIHLFWSAPLALWSVAHPAWEFGITLLVVAPLTVLAVCSGAGSRSEFVRKGT